jgi:hypothetical protein
MPGPDRIDAAVQAKPSMLSFPCHGADIVAESRSRSTCPRSPGPGASSPCCDLTRALLQATDHFLAADTAIIGRHVDTNVVFYLPCGPGLLLCSPIYCRTPENKYFTYAQARTWDQRRHGEAGPITIVGAYRRNAQSTTVPDRRPEFLIACC